MIALVGVVWLVSLVLVESEDTCHAIEELLSRGLERYKSYTFVAISFSSHSETIRFHLPNVFVTISNLRGRNTWDSRKLGPYMRRLQNFHPGNLNEAEADDDDEEVPSNSHGMIRMACDEAQRLLDEMLVRHSDGEDMIRELCGGIPSRMEPLRDWLKAIRDSIDEFGNEAMEVDRFVHSVAPGIQIGYKLVRQVNWVVPSEKEMRDSIVAHIKNKITTGSVRKNVVTKALQKLASKDARTLQDLVSQNLPGRRACELLMGRAVVLLEREIRRQALNDAIEKQSQGKMVLAENLKKGLWYWVKTTNRGSSDMRVLSYEGIAENGVPLFKDVDSDYMIRDIDLDAPIRQYIPVAEAISRAQKAFLIFELEYGKKFQYNAFMELARTGDLTSLRTRLRRLAVLSQAHCYELNKARLNVLQHVKQLYAGGNPNCPPQNAIVAGGGLTGLLCAVHCVENVLFSGGQVKVYESRDGK